MMHLNRKFDNFVLVFVTDAVASDRWLEASVLLWSISSWLLVPLGSVPLCRLCPWSLSTVCGAF